MKALLMTNSVQVTVQPYGITWSQNAKLGGNCWEYKDANFSWNFFKIFIKTI